MVNRKFDAVSENYREGNKKYEKLTHCIFKDLNGMIYLLGKLTFDTFIYFIEVHEDDYDDEFHEIKETIEKAIEEDVAMRWGHYVGYDYWKRSHRIVLLEAREEMPTINSLTSNNSRISRRIKFYEKYLNWDEVNKVMDITDAEKPGHTGWGIHYPTIFYDELSEIWNLDIMLLSENEYISNTYIRLLDHILESERYEGASMR